MVKVSDYIADYLAGAGVREIFMISGGAAMHLIDSIGRQAQLKYICTHHEQAAAIAAEGYARFCGKMGVVVVTSGPGGTNTLTGVTGQWLDSVPCLYISGQVKQETTIASCPGLGLRQLGDQEINIIDIVRPVTKYAEAVRDPLKIGYYLEKAIYLSTHGRPGPVWLDIPLDIQAAIIDESRLLDYDEKEEKPFFDARDARTRITQLLELLKQAKRPVFLAGAGIRIAKAQKEFLDFVDKIGMPVVSSFNGVDLIPTQHRLFIGRLGTLGDRSGNFAVQNSDLLLCVGTRNNIRQISYNWKAFARQAKKIIVDIDAAELAKPTVKPDLAIQADAQYFLEELKRQINNQALPLWDEWLKWCSLRKARYPAVLPEYAQSNQLVNPYYFIKILCECLEDNSIVVTGNGTASVVMFQAAIVRQGQRIIWNSGCASMGYDLPAAIGASFASGLKPVVCLAGDGSLQMNIQELQTVAHHKLPVKLFVLNNSGYASIRQTQDSFFEGRRFGCCPASGVSFPDISKIASAYGLKSGVIDSHEKIDEKIRSALNSPGPFVCDVRLNPEYKFSPKLSSERKPDGRIISKPLEDMYPFLSREEFKENMLIPPYPDD